VAREGPPLSDPAHGTRLRKAILPVALSLLLPGLGQVYNRDWHKAALFGIGGLLTGFGPLQPIDTGAVAGDPLSAMQSTLVATFPFLLLAAWSAVDAYRHARA